MTRKHQHPAGPSQRMLRVGEIIRHTLAELLLRTEINDPDLKGVHITVSEARPSPDLRHATIFVVPLKGEREAEVVAALNRHARFLRGELGHRIELKYVPEIVFKLDTSFDEYDKIDKLLHSPQVARDLKS
jgi:ribosome-binding factor A